MDNRSIAQSIAQLARMSAGDGQVCGLTAAQWNTLRFFARANRFSRPVSAFAEFHATTRGTASQTVKGLVSEGYLTRSRSDLDGRSVRFDLTEKGRGALSHDPLDALSEAIGKLAPGVRNQLASSLKRLTEEVADSRGKPSFGSCRFCCHLTCALRKPGGEPSYACDLLDQPLAANDLGDLCVNFETAQSNTAARSPRDSKTS